MRRAHGWVGRFGAMASPCEVHMPGAGREQAARLLDAVAAEAWRIEDKFSRYLEGNIVHRINTAYGATVTVDAETAGLLDYAARLHALSGGSFDITSGVLRRVWRFDGSDRVPASSDVQRLLRVIGWDKVRWRSPELTLAAGMEIDFGGIGKEYAVDRAGAIAAAMAPRCLLNFGGDLLAFGAGVDRGGWTIGIDGLCGESVPARRIRLVAGGIATSGDAARYLLKEGRRYGHILDPRTGWPVPMAPRSVTVLAPTCMEAGMLSTLAMLEGAAAEDFLGAQDVRFWVQR